MLTKYNMTQVYFLIQNVPRAATGQVFKQQLPIFDIHLFLQLYIIGAEYKDMITNKMCVYSL